MGILKKAYAGVVTGGANLILKGISKVTGKEYEKATSKEFLSSKVGNVLATAASVTAVAAGVAAAAPAIGAAGGVRAVAGSITKKQVIAGTGGLLLTGALVNEPIATSKAILNAPSNIANIGGNIATFAAAPSLESGKTIIQENPVLSSALGVATLGAAGVTAGTIATSLTNLQARGATKELTEQLSTGNQGVLQTTTGAGILGTSDVMTNADVITPQTTDITKKSYKSKRSKAQQQQINQLVKININNQNKKYLKVVAH